MLDTLEIWVASIIGGCCGTTHVHIKAISESLESYKPLVEKIDLDSIIKDLGSMTAGNIAMINNYLNPGSTQIIAKKRKKEKKKMNDFVAKILDLKYYIFEKLELDNARRI